MWKYLTKQAQQDKTLEEGVTVNDIAGSWITKDRLPVVTVTRDYAKKTAVASQRVYLRERPHDVPEQDKMLWWIPLILVTQDKLEFTNFVPLKWIKKQRETTLTDLPSADKFIIINPEEIGPFPVNYDVQNWNLLSNYLQTEDGRKKIPIYTRYWDLIFHSFCSSDNRLIGMKFQSQIIARRLELGLCWRFKLCHRLQYDIIHEIRA